MRSLIARHRRALALAVTCVAIGVGIGAITSAGASTTTAASSATAVAAGARHGRLRHRVGLLRRAVQGDAVVRTAGGFGTVSFQRGTVTAVSGALLTLTEGTPRKSYRSATVTIPAQAIVRDNHQRASLSSVTPGQRVLVIHAPHNTFVLAHTPASG